MYDLDNLLTKILGVNCFGGEWHRPKDFLYKNLIFLTNLGIVSNFRNKRLLNLIPDFSVQKHIF